MKQSPYLAFNCPSNPYSSVCSMAMFKYPSRQANTPRYSIPEFNLTRTGRPRTDFKKSDGERFLAVSVCDHDECGVDVCHVVWLRCGVWSKTSKLGEWPVHKKDNSSTIWDLTVVSPPTGSVVLVGAIGSDI